MTFRVGANRGLADLGDARILRIPSRAISPATVMSELQRLIYEVGSLRARPTMPTWSSVCPQNHTMFCGMALAGSRYVDGGISRWCGSRHQYRGSRP